MSCQHPAHTVVSERPFSGAVHRDQNRAAHGNVEFTDCCASCGALRRRNVNHAHVEVGEWGPSRAARQAEAACLAAHAERLIRGVTPLQRGENRACVGADGMIVVEGPGDHQAVARSLPETFLVAAKAARAAVLAAEFARCP